MNKGYAMGFIGQRHEMLLVTGVNETTNKLICLCDCGNKTEVDKYHFNTTKSCGCLRVKNKYKHGGKNTRLYNIWKAAKQRCFCQTSKNYKNYGARGITMCKEWADDFSCFREWALENGYDESADRGSCTLDRINIDSNYEPSNCRWISIQHQQLNKQNSHYITYKDKTQTLKEWADELGIKYGTLWRRINRLNMSVEKALTEPINKSMARNTRRITHESISS